MPVISCTYCDGAHGDMLLCAPARRVLDALRAREMRFDMPTLEFPDNPITGPGALGNDAVLIAQLTAKAAVIDVAGVARPALILSGLDALERRLPEWVFAAAPDAMNRAVRLVSDMAGLAVRTARKQPRGTTP